MTQSGGAGTHYGILYQTLSTIDAAFTIDSRGDELDPETVTLIVEPRGGGGDVVASNARRRPVLQFKARGDHGTWSLNEIIDDALSDLYRAVPPEPDSCSEYLLVTEGREGDIEEARAFFRELNRYYVPDDPLNDLEDAELRQYFPSGSPMTRREFFDHITRRLCRTSEDGEPVVSEYRRVWSLLSRFDILREVFEDVEQRVEQWLLAYVDAPEDVRPKADELCGMLLKLAAKGNQTFTLRSLLSRAGLPTMSLAELPAALGVRKADAPGLARE
jgi:hypothetical protein